MFSGLLGRESTIVNDGKYVKDFSYLGRPIKEVIYIDFDKTTAPFHPDNVIVLPEFEGDLNDRALYEIMPFLKRKYNCLIHSLLTPSLLFLYDRSCTEAR